MADISIPAYCYSNDVLAKARAKFASDLANKGSWLSPDVPAAACGNPDTSDLNFASLRMAKMNTGSSQNVHDLGRKIASNAVAYNQKVIEK